MLIDLTAAGIFEFENPYLHLLLDEPARLLYSAWVRQPTREEYREASGLFIKNLQEKDIAYWIQDVTNLEDLSQEDLHWVLEELMPAAQASALQKIARIAVEDTNLKAVWEVMSHRLSNFVTTIEVEQFPTYREAVAWIVGQPW